MSYLNLRKRYGDVDSAEDGLSLGEDIRQLSSLITCHCRLHIHHLFFVGMNL